MFDEKKKGRGEKEEDGGGYREGVVAVPSPLLMLCKLSDSCLTEVREREVAVKLN
jgi:hypothetical protein